MATHDVLTGLPNRLMFSQLLDHAIQSAHRNKRQLAVFFIDLDRSDYQRLSGPRSRRSVAEGNCHEI